MSFERLMMRAPSGRSGFPASVSLSSHSGGRPTVMISMTAVLVTEAGFSGDDKFDVLIGTDEDTGKVRVVSASDGVLSARRLNSNALTLNLGFVEAIGTRPRKKQFTTARVLSAGVVEIDLPEKEDEADDDDDDSSPSAVTVSAAGPRPVMPKPSSPKKPAEVAAAQPLSGVVTINGVTIDFTDDNESVAFRGKVIEVTTRHAKLTHLLARVRPQTVSPEFLVKTVWPDRNASAAVPSLHLATSDLRVALAPIGLDLNHVKGVGYQLKDL